MASMTWPAMPGNGSSIGTTMTTIRKARKRTLLGRQRVMEKWYGAGLGCTSLSFCVLRTDSTRNPPIGSLGMGSVARGYRKPCRVECSLLENSGSAHRTQHFSVYPYSLLGKRIVHIVSFLSSLSTAMEHARETCVLQRARWPLPRQDLYSRSILRPERRSQKPATTMSRLIHSSPPRRAPDFLQSMLKEATASLVPLPRNATDFTPSRWN